MGHYTTEFFTVGHTARKYCHKVRRHS